MGHRILFILLVSSSSTLLSLSLAASSSSSSSSQPRHHHVCESLDNLASNKEICPTPPSSSDNNNNNNATSAIYNVTLSSSVGGVPEEMRCTSESQYCFAMFCLDPITNNSKFIKQGCWQASVPRGPPYDKSSSRCGDSCVAYVKRNSSEQRKPYHFCCCSGPNCNANVRIELVDHTADEELLLLQQQDNNSNNSDGKNAPPTVVVVVVVVSAMVGLVLVLGGAVVIVVAKSRRGGGGFFFGKGGEEDANLQSGESACAAAAESSFLLPPNSSAAAMMQQYDPSLLDKHNFSLTQQIARGRWGTIYRGRWLSSSSSPNNSNNEVDVALKMYASPHHRDFYENEKLIYSLVKHPNILPYHGHYEFTSQDESDQQQQQQQQNVFPGGAVVQHHLVLVFDLATCNLRDYLETTPTLAPSTALHISQGVARGLSHLHSLDNNKHNAIVAHRDVTPRNVLVRLHEGEMYPEILLADFGLSLLTKGSKYYEGVGLRERQAEFCSLTEAGTLRYMAPELLEGAVNLKDCENALKQADVYSLALLLWEVNNACPAFRVKTSCLGNNQQQQQQQPEQGQGQDDDDNHGNVMHQAPFAEETEDEESNNVGAVVGVNAGDIFSQQTTVANSNNASSNNTQEGKEMSLSLETMVRLVVSERRRPGFHRWVDTPVTRSLRDTLCESWDSEPDARLTSVCVLERLSELKNNLNKTLSARNNNSSGANNQPLEAKYVPPRPTFDEPWTGRNVCLERNLLRDNFHETAGGVSTTGGSVSGGGGGHGGEMSSPSVTLSTELSDMSSSDAPTTQLPPTTTHVPLDTHKKNITLILNKF